MQLKIISWIAIFAPLLLVARAHWIDISIPIDARTGFSRVAGIPVFWIVYCSWFVVPLIFSPRFRSQLVHPFSLIAVVFLLGHSVVGYLGGNGARFVLLDLQLWLGIWAGYGLAYTAAATGAVSRVHNSLIVWHAVGLGAALVAVSEGLVVGQHRILDPIAFHYIGLLLPLAGMALVANLGRPKLGLLIGIVATITLLVLSAVVMIARSYTIAGIITIATLVVARHVDGVRLRGGASELPSVFAAIAVLSIAFLLIAPKLPGLELLYRFSEDSYSTAENARLVEARVALGQMDLVNNFLGGGLGWQVRNAGDSALGLHMGILTLVPKFGWPIAVGLWLVILYYIVRVAKAIFRPASRSTVARAELLASPAVFALLTISLLSGGYYEFTMAVIGYLFGTIQISRSAQPISSNENRYRRHPQR